MPALPHTMRKKVTELIHLIISGILILAIGSLGGYTVGFLRATRQASLPIQTIPDINEGVATIQFTGIEKGELKGQLTGRKARIAYDKNPILILAPGDTFGIPMPQTSIGASTASANAPVDAQFVASKRGKYYYSVSDTKAQQLSPKNRIYFKTKEEAEKKGYKPK
ncbi:MAG: hypothetical protein V1908_02780 [Candidatus Peregrinibacteria bacterium]